MNVKEFIQKILMCCSHWSAEACEKQRKQKNLWRNFRNIWVLLVAYYANFSENKLSKPNSKTTILPWSLEQATVSPAYVVNRILSVSCFIGSNQLFDYIIIYYYQYTRPNRQSASSKHKLSGAQKTDSGLLMHYQPYSWLVLASSSDGF